MSPEGQNFSIVLMVTRVQNFDKMFVILNIFIYLCTQ